MCTDGWLNKIVRFAGIFHISTYPPPVVDAETEGEDICTYPTNFGCPIAPGPIRISSYYLLPAGEITAKFGVYETNGFHWNFDMYPAWMCVEFKFTIPSRNETLEIV